VKVVSDFDHCAEDYKSVLVRQSMISGLMHTNALLYVCVSGFDSARECL